MEKFAKLYNGVLMPRVGFGTWQLQGSECYDAVLHALKNGYTLIDTASVYQNEMNVGEAIKDYGGLMSKSGAVPQFETGNDFGIFVTSKANTKEIGEQETYNACNRSLSKLGLPKLDLYLLHWPGCDGIAIDNVQNRQKRREAWMAMEKLYNEGKVRAIGVSNYLVNHLNQLMQDGITIKPMINQVEYHPMCQNEELIQWATENNMHVQAYSSLGIGNSKLLSNEVVVQVSNETGKTPAQVLLRWALQKSLLVIPRSKTKERIVENFDLGFLLDESHMQALTNISDAARFCWDPTKVA